MAVYGITDSQFVSLPANIDLTYLRQLELRDGTTFAEVIPMINGQLAAYNAVIEPAVAALIAPATAAITINGRAPGAFEINRTNEWEPGRPQMPQKPFAHALPIWQNDASMMWTEEGLENMATDDLMAEIEDALTGFRLQTRSDIYGRLLDPAEVPVELGNATTMLSPGFAGSGSGLNAFQAKRFPDASLIPQPYSHYWACPVGSLGATLLAMRNQQKRWFPTGNFEFTGSLAMVNAIMALGDAGGFTPVGRALIREATTGARAELDDTQYVGIFDIDILVRKPVLNFPFTDLNGWLTQPLGDLNTRNPLAWRYDPKKGKGIYLRSRGNWPLTQTTLRQKMGVGVNNRVGAELLRIDAGGVYSPPTGFSALGT